MDKAAANIPQYRVPKRVQNYMQEAGVPPEWWERWRRKVWQAWQPDGKIVHKADTTAPNMTLARYGFLLPLTDNGVAEAWRAYKQACKERAGCPVSDKQRKEFECAYILARREVPGE